MPIKATEWFNMMLVGLGFMGLAHNSLFKNKIVFVCVCVCVCVCVRAL